MMISGIGERKRENNLLLFISKCCKGPFRKIAVCGF